MGSVVPFNQKKMKLILVLQLFIQTIFCCTSVRHKQLQSISKQVLTNEVESYPSLFTHDLTSSHRYKRSMCPKARPSRTCQVVTIYWDALRAAKMRFLMAPPSDEAILKKTSQEGLEMVLDQHLKGTTATITYKQHNEDNVIFVVQENHIFGSLHDADHGKFSIKPCPYNETCHVLMQKMP